MEPLKFPETGEVCAVDGDDRTGGVTGLNCAGFGSAMVVTATFGMVAASQVLLKLAESVQPAVPAAATM
jgi:tRNA A37 threonylcarbamoyladenosine dehydratase